MANLYDEFGVGFTGKPYQKKLGLFYVFFKKNNMFYLHNDGIVRNGATTSQHGLNAYYNSRPEIERVFRIYCSNPKIENEST